MCPTRSVSLFLVTVCAASLAAQTQFVLRTPGAIGVGGLYEAVAADVDGDGDLDLMGCGQAYAQPQRRLLLNQGNDVFVDVSGSWLPPQSILATGGNGIVIAKDFDGDGYVEMLSSLPGSLVLWRNYMGTLLYEFGFADPGGYTDLLAVDLDGDGAPEIAASGTPANGSTNLVFRNLGLCTFTHDYVLPTTPSQAIAAADLDGDHDQDLLLGSSAGLLVLRNDGGLVFTDVSATWVGAAVPGSIRDIAVGDLDGDGDADLVVARQGVANDTVLLNTGAAFATGPSYATAASGSKRLTLVDVDADGKLDLWRGSSAGLGLMLGNGLGGFTSGSARVAAIANSASCVLPFDFDRDGDADLLVADPSQPALLLANRDVDLRPGQPVNGQLWQPQVASQAGFAAAPHLVGFCASMLPLPSPHLLAPYGWLGIDFTAGVVLGGATTAPAGSAVFPIPVPAAPQVVGIELYLQGVVAAPGATPRLTSWYRVVIQ